MPGNTQEFSDSLSVLYEKIGEFEAEQNEAWMLINMPAVAGTMNIPWNLIYKLGTVRVDGNQAELLNNKDFNAAMLSPLTAPSINRPICTTGALGLRVAIAANELVQPGTGANMSISFMMRPPRVEWAYVIVNNKALYNDNIAVDFELHSSEETELVYKILKLAGINLKAQEVVQVGQTLEQTNKQTTL